MSELDQHLKQLAIEAQQHPPKTQERQRALDRLFRGMEESGKLAHFRSACPYPLESSYEEIYLEGVQKLFCYITEHIERYDPEKGEVLQWANGILRWRFQDAVGEFNEFFVISGRATPILSLNDLDHRSQIQASAEVNPSLSEEIIQVIKEDPDGIFENTYSCNNPQANFKFIALQRANGQPWKTIAEQVGNPIGTLSKFYQGCLKKFAPQIRAYISQ